MIPTSLLDTDVLCVYSDDPCAVIDELKEWLGGQQERYLLIFAERDDPRALLVSLQQRSRVRLILVDQEVDEELFKQAAWEYVFLRISYFAACRGESKKRAEMLFAKMQELHAGVHLVTSDYRDFGIRILDNVSSNMRRLKEAKSGRSLFGSFKKIPAIICGAGPSLNQQIALLHTLQDRALLFAGGSSLNIFAKHGLAPHFAAGIDPDPPQERLAAQASFKTPFFYQSRVAAALLSTIQAPLLWMGDSGGYPLEEWLHSACGIEEPLFDGGWNVATFCTALSVALGCDPIIFVGVDLSSAGEELYAEGVEEKTKGLLSTLDAHGKLVHARRDWLFAKEWLEAFARQHPDRTFIQTSPGGLALSGILRYPLERAAEKYCQKTQDLYAHVQRAVEELSPLCIDEKKIEEVMQEVQESLKRSEERCVRLLTLFEEQFPKLPGDSGAGALLEVELEEEIAFRQILEPLWKIWQPIYTRRTLEMGPPHVEHYLQKLLFLRKVSHEQRKVCR